MNEIVQKLQMQIAQSDLKEVFDDLFGLMANCIEEEPESREEVKELRADLLVLSGTFSDAEKRSLQGIIRSEEYNLINNQVRVGVIHILDKLHEYENFYFFLENLEEDRAWKTAMNQNSISAYEKYFSKYPKGKYVAETEKIIKDLSAELRRKAEQEHERRKVLNNISHDKKKKAPAKKQENVDVDDIKTWWNGLPKPWRTILLSEIGFVGKTTIKAVERVLQLKIIDLSNNETVNTLTPIKYLRGIRTLNLHKSKINNLDGVETLVNLEEIDLSYTNIRSLEPLQSLKKMRSLVYSQLPAEELRRFHSFNPICKVIQKK